MQSRGLYVLAAWTLAAQHTAVAPAGVADYYRGAWHLALAEGRASCPAVDGPFSGELRALTLKDIEAMSTGRQALSQCPGAPTRTPPPPDRVFENWRTTGDARIGLARMREAYSRGPRESSCGYAEAELMRFELISKSATLVGSAASRTLCVIPTWNRALPADVGRSVLADVRLARTAIDGLTKWIKTDAAVTKLSAADGQIEGGGTGEVVYQHLLAASAALELCIRGGRP